MGLSVPCLLSRSPTGHQRPLHRRRHGCSGLDHQRHPRRHSGRPESQRLWREHGCVVPRVGQPPTPSSLLDLRSGASSSQHVQRDPPGTCECWHECLLVHDGDVLGCQLSMLWLAPWWRCAHRGRGHRCGHCHVGHTGGFPRRLVGAVPRWQHRRPRKRRAQAVGPAHEFARQRRSGSPRRCRRASPPAWLVSSALRCSPPMMPRCGM